MRSATSSIGSTEPIQAATCLKDAEDIYALADTHPGRLQTAIPYDFYPEKEWRDDLEWGATELYDALSAGPVPAGTPNTDAMYYLRQAAHWAHAYITGPYDADDTLNLYDVTGLAHFELYKAIEHAGNPERPRGHQGRSSSADLASSSTRRSRRATRIRSDSDSRGTRSTRPATARALS